jgi:hypothetical protein
MKIEIKISKDKPKAKQKEETIDITEKGKHENLVVEHIKHLSWKKKLVYGGIATAILVNAADNKLDEQKSYVGNQGIKYVEENAKQYTDIVNEAQAADLQMNIVNPIKVEAKEVLTDYTNAVSYEEQKSVDAIYKNQYLEVTGKVNEIIDQDTITLMNENSSKWYSEWVGIECNFNNQVDLEQIQNLQKGTEVDIIGYCTGYDKMTVELDNCIIKSMN